MRNTSAMVLGDSMTLQAACQAYHVQSTLHAYMSQHIQWVVMERHAVLRCFAELHEVAEGQAVVQPLALGTDGSHDV